MVVIQKVVHEKIQKILELLKERKNKTDNVNTLVETSLSVLLGVLNNEKKKADIFPKFANAILNGKDINNHIKENKEQVSPENTRVLADFASKFVSSILKRVEDEKIRDELKNAMKLVESLKSQEIATNNVEQLVNISTKILQEISNTVSQTPPSVGESDDKVEPDIERLRIAKQEAERQLKEEEDKLRAATEETERQKKKAIIEKFRIAVLEAARRLKKAEEEKSQQVSQVPLSTSQNIQPTTPLVAASTYYNSMIKKNSDIGTFLAAAIGNALIDNKPTMIQNILTELTKTGAVFKNYFKGIDMNAMKARLTNLSLPSPTLPNVKLSLSATNDIFRLTIGYPLAFIKYCAEQGIKISQDMIDKFKQQVATTLDPNAGEKSDAETHMEDADKKKTEKDTDTPQKELNCSDPITIKLGQLEDTALCFDPKQNKVIATK